MTFTFTSFHGEMKACVLFTLTLVLYRLQSEVEGEKQMIRSRCCRVPDDNLHFSYFSVVLVALDSYLFR